VFTGRKGKFPEAQVSITKRRGVVKITFVLEVLSALHERKRNAGCKVRPSRRGTKTQSDGPVLVESIKQGEKQRKKDCRNIWLRQTSDDPERGATPEKPDDVPILPGR